MKFCLESACSPVPFGLVFWLSFLGRSAEDCAGARDLDNSRHGALMRELAFDLARMTNEGNVTSLRAKLKKAAWMTRFCSHSSVPQGS
ncbi:MAG: hypothetical protein OXD33_11610 [Rhodobacteraceae bacterium]|nr:hypothetical protein [Paracoccaceae bacterium]